MKSFFNKKLYWEGIKKVKVLGIATAAISAILCALIPLIHMLDWYSTPAEWRSTYTVPTSYFCVPLLLILMLSSMLIVLSMFSFLNKRSESDFYHAIPYKRTCVYTSFVLACLTWLAFTALISVAAAAFFWFIDPGVTVGFSVPFLNLGIALLLSLMLVSITAVAMTITGTTISNILILGLMLCFVRVVGALFITILDSIVPLLHIPLTPARILQPEFNLPIAVFCALIGFGYSDRLLFNNAPMIVYTLIVSLILLVAGCLLYHFRKSEMATKSAPNKFLQHTYRCMISLPLALIAVWLIYMGEDFAFVLTIIVLTLIVYYLYELITTKRFKNLAKATPVLAVLVGICLLFVGGAELTKVFTLAYTPDADEIKSVGRVDTNGSMFLYVDGYSYEELQTSGIEIDTPEALEIVSEALKDSVEHTENGTFYDYDDYYYYTDGYYDVSSNTVYQTYKITDKSGKVCGRYLRMTENQLNRLESLFTESEDYAEALIKMPSDKEVQSVSGAYYYADIDIMKYEKLWDSLLEEYDSLTYEQKIEYKSSLTDYYPDVEIQWTESGKPLGEPPYCIVTSLDVSGMVGTQTFYSSYPLRTDLFPETCDLYISMFNELGGHYSSVYGADSLRWLFSTVESASSGSIEFSLDVSGYGTIFNEWYNKDNDPSGEKFAKLKEIAEYLLDHAVSSEDANYFIEVICYSNYGPSGTYAESHVLVPLDSESYHELSELYGAYQKEVYGEPVVVE